MSPVAKSLEAFEFHTCLPLAAPNAGTMRGVCIATGASIHDHGVESATVLDTNPWHLRRLLAADSNRPWLWEIAQDAGKRVVVCNWAGPCEATDSRVPMACSDAFSRQPAPNGAWPLSPLFVSSETIRDSITSTRVAASSIPDDALPEFDVALIEAKKRHVIKRSVRITIAETLSTLAAVNVMSNNADLVMIGLRLPTLGPLVRPLGEHVLGLALNHLCEQMGPELQTIVVSMRERQGTCTIAGPLQTQRNGNDSIAKIIDIAPSALAVLGIEQPELMTGNNLFVAAPPEDSHWTQEVAADGQVDLGRLGELVEAITTDSLDALPRKRRVQLRRYATNALRRRWQSAYRQRNLNVAYDAALLLDQLRSNKNSLWLIAYSCHLSGKTDERDAMAQRLLADFPGSDAALLAGALGASDATEEQLESIVEAIDTDRLNSTSMQSICGRLALRAGRVELAVELLERVIKSQQAQVLDRVMLAQALLRADDSKRARTVLGAIGTSPSAPLRWRLLSVRVLIANNMLDEAKTLVDLILKTFPFENGAEQLRKKIELLQSER